MWVFFALGSAVFAALTSILAKCGIKKTDSDVATAVRTGIVLLFSWIMVFLSGSQGTMGNISHGTWLFLILSGLATGGSWLFYFKALQEGEINKVIPIDKSSTALTVVLAMIFLGEEISLLKCACVLAIAAGTLLMVGKASPQRLTKGRKKGNAWLFYAIFSALFASLSAILGKVGIQDVESNLGTAIRTGIVLAETWIIVFAKKKTRLISIIPKKELSFILLSGLATGGSWLCYYKALHDGPVSAVVPLDKLSILFTVAFSFFIFRERLTAKSAFGLLLIVAGTLAMLL